MRRLRRKELAVLSKDMKSFSARPEFLSTKPSNCVQVRDSSIDEAAFLFFDQKDHFPPESAASFSWQDLGGQKGAVISYPQGWVIRAKRKGDLRAS